LGSISYRLLDGIINNINHNQILSTTAPSLIYRIEQQTFHRLVIPFYLFYPDPFLFRRERLRERQPQHLFTFALKCLQYSPTPFHVQIPPFSNSNPIQKASQPKRTYQDERTIPFHNDDRSAFLLPSYLLCTNSSLRPLVGM